MRVTPKIRRLLAVLLAAAGGLIVAIAGLPDRASSVAVLRLESGDWVAAEVGALAPPFALTDSNGQAVNFDPQKADGVTVINFWATWCAPCRIEMPDLQALHAAYQGRGLRMIGINLAESPQDVERWAQEFALTFPLPIDSEGRVARDYRLRGQPTTVIVAARGRITQIIYGPVDITTLEQAVITLLPTTSEQETP